VEIDSLDEQWHDAARDRAIPVRIYHAPGEVAPHPVILFSHGVGGSRSGYAYLARHWASHGYVCVHLEHLGTNASVWKGAVDVKAALREAATDPANIIDRALDVRFAIDRLERLAGEAGPLAGRLDLGRIGVAGHSMGAYTVLAATGQLLSDAQGRECSLPDQRIKAAIVMSPTAPQCKDQLDRIFAGIRVPMMHLTGTRDESPIGLTPAAERRTAFDHIRARDQFLVLFRNADHMAFVDLKRGAPGRGRQAVFHPRILAATTAFWDGYLKGNAQAQRWLSAELDAEMAEQAIVEKKL
jgi:predicted dienelactone hydrolase